MMRRRTPVVVHFCALLAVVGTSRLMAAQNGDLAEQLKSVYKISTRAADSNGMRILQPGTVLTIQQPGLLGVPDTNVVLATASYKNGELHPPGAGSKMFAGNNTRFLEPGEKVYVIKLNVNPKNDRVSFSVEECDSCNQVSEKSSYISAVNFDFPKGSLATATVKDVVDTVNKVLALDASAMQPQVVQASAQPPAQAAPVQLKFPAVYVNSRNAGDRIQLNADKSFTLQEGGQPYHGTFTEKGNSLDLNIAETNSTTSVTLQGNILTDSSGQQWNLKN